MTEASLFKDLEIIKARMENDAREKLALESKILELSRKKVEVKTETKVDTKEIKKEIEISIKTVEPTRQVEEEDGYDCVTCGIPDAEPECQDKWNHCLCKTCKCVFCAKTHGEQFYDEKRGEYRHIGRCCACMPKR